MGIKNYGVYALIVAAQLAAQLGSFTTTASAALATADSSTVDQTISKQSQDSSRVYVTAEINAGPAFLSDGPGGQFGGSGSQVELLALGSWRMSQRWSLQGGAGWARSGVSGTTEIPGFGKGTYVLNTNAVATQMSPQFYFTDALQAGLIAECLIGDDLSYSTRLSNSSQTTAWFGGVQALYGLSLGKQPIKLGARYLTAISLPDRTMQMVQATMQINFGVY